jgi:hypothetical protein
MRISVLVRPANAPPVINFSMSLCWVDDLFVDNSVELSRVILALHSVV